MQARGITKQTIKLYTNKFYFFRVGFGIQECGKKNY